MNDALPVYPLRFHFQAEDEQPWEYRGSAWRGAFGRSLKRLLCVFHHGDCQGCPLRASCGYIQLFEPRSLHEGGRGDATPYALYPHPCEGGEYLHISLFGRQAAGYAPFVIQAVKLAGEGGVHRQRLRPQVCEMFDGRDWHPLNAKLHALEAPPPWPGGALRVQMRSPLRFKHQGRLVTPQSISAELWFGALRRRLTSLAASLGDEARMRERLAELPTQVAWRDARWHWQEQTRRSARQRCRMRMGGLLGTFTLDAETAEPWWPMLWLGQWTHTGKQASQGLGRYELSLSH